jgi:hypothetical protein
VRHRLRNDHQAIGQNMLADIARLRRHNGIVTYRGVKKKSGKRGRQLTCLL